ncbi:hypothetical protein HL667_01090 [Bradyrhizobium sp. 83012]|uniref:Uncharacterized protein n=1 Tax=Bradyrhizobium aeschynomenes TaxID=2734909 RepID=A0ABX2C5L8_9BRAD|nr:hypothetical protein [Bradyrhizobium aeschynomenes]NPU63588.1 hypothetical protein [Bradyrhizobium aeschynomenes]
MPGTLCDKDDAALDALGLLARTVTGIIERSQPPEPVAIDYVYDHHDLTIRWVRKGPELPLYWPPYQEAIAALSARESSAKQRQLRSGLLMERYFQIMPGPLPRGGDAQNTRDNLTAQSKHLNAIVDAYKKGGDLIEIGARAQKIASEFATICQYLIDLDPSMQTITCLQTCLQTCEAVPVACAKIKSGAIVDEARAAASTCLRNLIAVRDALRSIIYGFCIVTNNEAIPHFFLLRLLVPYSLIVKKSEDGIYRSIASSQLTKLLHNEQEWLFKLLQRMIAALSRELDGKVVFFLKGGRGLAYLLGTPERGENDWDTQILIDPHLPPDEWWRLYEWTRAIVDNMLLRDNFVFSANLMANAQSLAEATKTYATTKAVSAETVDKVIDNVFVLAWQDMIDENALGLDPLLSLESVWRDIADKPSGSCKAELIDVGIPRYYTIELLQQWRHVRGGINSVNGVPYPGASYFIDDLIDVIRESDAGISPSSNKRETRLARLLEVLGTDDAQLYVAWEQGFVKTAGLVLCQQQVSRVGLPRIRDLAWILLGQFCVAYELALDPGLAEAFDVVNSATLKDLIDGMSSENEIKQAGLVFKWCDAVSAMMTMHLAERGRFVLSQNSAIFGLTAQVAVAPKVSAVAEGSYAANLHRLFASPTIEGNVIPAEFAAIDLHYETCVSESEISDSQLDGFAQTVEQAASRIPAFGIVGKIDVLKTVNVFAKTSLPLGTTSYCPLLIRFSLRPRLSSNIVLNRVGPLAVSGLLELIPWCRGRAADVGEWATRWKLAETLGTLIAMEAAVLARPPRQLRAKL